MSEITLKRGDTLLFTASYTDAQNNPITGIATQLKSQVRNPVNNKLISELAISESATLGTYVFRDDTTNNFPITKLICDIQRTDNGIISSSATLNINVIADVTQ